MTRLTLLCASTLPSLLLLLISTPSLAQVTDECANWQTAHPEWLFCDDFESADLSNWIDVSGISVTSATSSTHNGSSAAEISYAVGGTGGYMWKKSLRTDNGNRDEQYVRWWQKWEPGFEWNNAPGGDQKLFMLTALAPQNAWGQTANWKIYVHLIGQERAGQGVAINETFLDRFIWDGTSQWSGQWYGLQQNTSVSRYRLDTWECTEIQVVHNTPGQANGEVRMWINDSLSLEKTNFKLRDDPISWNALQLNAYYGGGGSTRNQKSWVDQVIVSTSRIGCTTLGDPPSGNNAPEPPTNLMVN